jgi:hypothetical protein
MRSVFLLHHKNNMSYGKASQYAQWQKEIVSYVFSYLALEEWRYASFEKPVH